MTLPQASAQILGLSLLLGASALSSGCDVLDNLKDGVQLPTGGLNRVDLVKAPTAGQTVTWSCYEFVGFGCGALGNKPSPAQMEMSFDLVFDLANPNDSIPIPLVEILLGLSVFKDQNLGVTCISFCDPAEEDCEPQTDAEGACQADNAEEVDEGSDLVPNVDDLVDIGRDVADGGLDNWSFRTIEPKSSLEAHIQFDLGTDVTLGLAKNLLEDAATDALSGRNPSVTIPYTANGTLFFDLPKARKGVGFGPFVDEWELQ